MKEVKSESNLVGKRITCLLCNRTFEIEAGDKVLPGFTIGSSKSLIRKPSRLILGCGHEFYLVKNEPDTDVVAPVYQFLTEGYNPDNLLK